jgi:cell division protease FtsH
LLEKEVIFKENVEEIFGKRPWDKEETEDTTAEVLEATTPEEATPEGESSPETE